MAVVGVAWADEVVYKTALFGSDYNSKTVSSYTDTWTATNDGFVVTLANFNNNNNGWDYVKCGRKNNASVATITTGAVEEAITKVDVTIDAITAAKVNSIKLYISSDNSNWDEAGSFDKSTGAKTVTLANPAADLYYKIEFDCASGTSNGLVTVSKVELYYDDSATPSTNPSISAENVNIAYDATGGEIEYTIENPVTGTSLEANTAADWVSNINVGASSITFSTTENEGNAARIATFILTYEGAANKNVTVTQAGNPNAPGTENNPYTVAEARAAIDANTGVTGVYAKGIVSGIVTAFDSQYGNISYNISTDGTTTADQLQAYRGKSYGGANFTSANDIQVGDEVVIYGNLKKYGETYEFDQNNQLVSLNRPVYIEVSSYGEELLAGASGSTTVTVTYKGIDPETFDIAWFDQTGADAQESDWLLAEINSTDDPEVYELTYEFDENTSTEARAAYFKVVALDNDAQLVESPLITVTQAGFVQEYDVFFVLENDETFVPNSDFETVLETVPAGTYTLPSATKEGYRLEGWNDGSTTTPAGTAYNIDSDVEFTAVWVEKGEEYYALVTSTDEIENGEYLIVYTDGSLAFNGSLETLDAVGNTIDVTIEDDKIECSDEVDAATFTIASVDNGYSIQSKSGMYIGQTSDANGLNTSSTTAYTNAITISENNADIISGGAYLRYNSASNQNRFRYYKSASYTNQKAIQLYKKVETTPAQTVTIKIKDDFTATTFSCDKALDFSEAEITAYAVYDENGGTDAVMYAAAGEGLYIEGEPGTYEIPIYQGEDELELIDGNLLVGTVNEAVNTKALNEGDYTYYLFGKQNGKQAFFKVGENTSDAKATASAGKAYLRVPGANNAKEMIVIGGDVTGIESIENGTIVNDNYYTIDGKLVKGQPTQKGIYVVNGRKVVIK